MRVSHLFQKGITFLLSRPILWLCSAAEASQVPPNHQKLATGYFWYEAIFLDKEEVEKAFNEASGNYPRYMIVPVNYHVTTHFMPEPKHERLYGKHVTVHIIGYANGSVQDTRDNIASENEGLLVELSSTDEEIQALIDSCDKKLHITGSYSVAAMYTEWLDFSDCIPIDKTIGGVFGFGDSNGTIISDQQN